MSPRPSARDPRTIRVHLATVDATGTGRPEDGGGPIGGGLLLANRFTADIDDVTVPHAITVTLAAIDGALAIESITTRQVPDSPAVAVTGTALRRLTLDTYATRVRAELDRRGGTLIRRGGERTDPAPRSSNGTSPEPGTAAERAQRRRERPPITLGQVAAHYRDALASDDPKARRAPTATVARALAIHRGHAARLVAQARTAGLLRPARPGRSGEAPPDPEDTRDDRRHRP